MQETQVQFLGWEGIPVFPYLITATAFALFFTVYRTHRKLWNRDMKAKREQEASK